MFVGGALLTLTLGNLWLQARKERTAELHQRLRSVQRHMYWSMSPLQRVDVLVEGDLVAYYRRRRRQHRMWNTASANSWWNGKVLGFSSWTAKPGAVARQADLLKIAAGRHVAAGWSETKRAASAGGSWAADRIKDAVWWREATAYLVDHWNEEKIKWQHAHAHAIETVHPAYSRSRVPESK
ncbi:hypothetical protein IWW51_005251 [Coemansia sp. RSA 2702]|nr:hypothetical protein IWW51_005251 [Coemansia sp. RSA 2702]